MKRVAQVPTALVHPGPDSGRGNDQIPDPPAPVGVVEILSPPVSMDKALATDETLNISIPVVPVDNSVHPTVDGSTALDPNVSLTIPSQVTETPTTEPSLGQSYMAPPSLDPGSPEAKEKVMADEKARNISVTAHQVTAAQPMAQADSERGVRLSDIAARAANAERVSRIRVAMHKHAGWKEAMARCWDIGNRAANVGRDPIVAEQEFLATASQGVHIGNPHLAAFRQGFVAGNEKAAQLWAADKPEVDKIDPIEPHYEDGLHVEESPGNNAWLLMWNDDIIEMYAEKAEANDELKLRKSRWKNAATKAAQSVSYGLAAEKTPTEGEVKDAQTDRQADPYGHLFEELTRELGHEPADVEMDAAWGAYLKEHPEYRNEGPTAMEAAVEEGEKQAQLQMRDSPAKRHVDMPGMRPVSGEAIPGTGGPGNGDGSKVADEHEAAIGDNPEKWKKFWHSLVGDVACKRTKCMEEMDGKVNDPGAFCNALSHKFGSMEHDAAFDGATYPMKGKGPEFTPHTPQDKALINEGHGQGVPMRPQDYGKYMEAALTDQANMKDALSKEAVDEETKKYYDNYYGGYGKELTKDVALPGQKAAAVKVAASPEAAIELHKVVDLLHGVIGKFDAEDEDIKRKVEEAKRALEVAADACEKHYSSLTAADASAKSYFTEYFHAYGKLLTRDGLALRKVATSAIEFAGRIALNEGKVPPDGAAMMRAIETGINQPAMRSLYIWVEDCALHGDRNEVALAWDKDLMESCDDKMMRSHLKTFCQELGNRFEKNWGIVSDIEIVHFDAKKCEAVCTFRATYHTPFNPERRITELRNPSGKADARSSTA